MMSEIRETGISRYEQENLNTKDKDVNSEVMSTLDKSLSSPSNKSLSPRHEDDVNCNNISMESEQSTEGNLSSGACDPGEVHTTEDSSSDAQETTSPNNPGEVHTAEDSSSDAQETTSPNNPGEVHTAEDSSSDAQETTSPNNPGDVHTTGDSSSDAQETTSPNNPGEVHTTEDSSSDAQETTSPNNPGEVHTTEDSSSDAQETISPNNPGDVHTTGDSSSDAQETTSPNNPGDVHTTEDSSGNVCQNINEATPEDEKEDQADHGKEYVSLDPETFVSLESESKPTVNQDSKPVLHQDSEPKVCQDIAPATSEPPSTDITSASLVTPATSEPPSTDVTSASLVTPATSEPPSTDVTSASHVADVTSATSEPLSTDVTSASHVADVTPATSEPPSTDVTSASHVADVTPATSEPPSTDVTSASLVENVTSATSEPPSTDITSVPLVADVTPATSEPPSADVTSVPLMEDVTPATSETPTEDVIPDPPTKDVTPEPPTEDVIPATSEPPTEDVIPEPPTKDVTPEPPTEDVIPATSEPPTEDVIPEPPTEDATPATSEPPTEDIIPDPPTKDVIPATSEPPTEDVTPEPSAKDATAATSEPPTEDVIPEPPTKDASPATSEPPTEDIIPKPAGSQQPTEENSSKLLVPSDTGTVNTTRSSVITSPDHEPRDADRHSTQTEDKGGDEGGDKPGDNKEKKRTFIFSESPGGLRAQVPVTIRVGPAVTLPVNSSGINLTPIAIEKAPGNRLLERPTAPYHVITNIIAKNQKAAHTSDNSSRPLLSGPISLLSNPASLISGSSPLLCAPVIPSLSLAKDSASTPGMPAFTAVAPTVLTAATSVIATATATPRHSQGRKPVLSAGISSNLAALFPSFSKFSTSTTPQSSAVSANVSPLVGVERPAVVVAEDAQQKQRNVLVGVIPTTPSGHTAPSSVIDISGVLSNPVPVITHISSLKGSNVIPSAQDKDRLNHISGARLKVGSAEMLHVPSEIEQVPQVDLSAQAQTYTLDLSQLRMPQILGVQTVPHPQKFGGLMAALNGKGIPGASLPEPVAVMKLVNSVTSSPGQAEAAKNPGQSSHIKSAPHPVARRIWMSSCRPLDPASLERIGSDSKGNVYWYDGGKNMFQSPPSSDPAYKPSESELQLACKSMVQWTAKLKDLRTSDDIKLAQIIKDQFLNRVRVSTQRKSRDVTMFQKLQAVHNYSISNQTSNHPLPIPSNSSNQIKIVSSTTSSGGGNTSTNSVLQSTFPQGSILVVPHPTSPFHTMLPVFANPAAVLMPQGTGAQSSVTAAATSLNVTMATVSSTGGVATLLQPASITSGGGSSVLGAQQPIAIDGRLLGITGPNTSADRTQMMQIVQQAMASAGVCSPIIHTPTGKAPPTSTTPTSAEKERNKWEKKDKVLSSQEVLRRTVSHPMVYSMTVKDPVQLIKVSFESKSIEIAGEVPIKKMEVDSLSPDRFDKGEARKGEEGKDGEGEGGEGVASERREVEGDNKESLNIDEKDKEDLERTKQKSESTEVDGNVSKETVHEPYQLGTSAFHGHSSADLMSAELLLSLTGNSRQDWSISPNKSTPSKPTVASKNDILVTSSPSSSGPQTPSSARKRKQKPIASAKPQTDTPPEGKVPQGEGGVTPVVSGKRRRARKKKADDVDQSASQASAKKKGTKEKPVSKSKQFTPEELLEILNITPSVSLSKSNRGGVAGKGGARTKLKSRDSAALETGDFASSSRASDKMEELKASREIKPMKEYVIETDSDSNSSSSSSSSSRFTPNSNSSSDSSSDSSSNEDSSGSRSKDMTPGQERVKEKGRGSKKKTESQSSSSDDSSSDEEERTKGSAKRGGARGRGLSRGAILHGGHVVSIPTHLLKKKIKHSKKLKLISREVEGGSDKDAVPSKKPADFSADAPVDLATLYASKGGVDLSILSELTKSVGASDVMEKTRSKRTCVRVREEISKLEEILKDDTTEGKPSAISRTRGGGGGRGRGRGLNARASLGTGRIVEDESAESGGVLSSVKKAKKATYSQFTHKRRKRKRKAPEEEPLWQPARKQPPGDTLKTVYIFSTHWANEAAEAVLKEKCNTIIQFHQKQPKDPGFHRHPRIEDEKLSDENEQEKTPDEGEMEEEVVKEVSVVKGQKRKSLQGNTKSAPPPPPAVKRRRNSSQHGKTPPRSHSPPSFLRSSQRLRRQRNQSPVVAASPPVAPVEDEEEEESQPSPAPVSPPSPPVAQLLQLGGSRGRVTRASQRLAKAKQKNDPSNKQEVPKEGENSSSEEDSLMSFPKRNKISEESHTDKEEDKDEEEEESEERKKEIIDPVSKIQSSADSPQVDTNKSSNPPPLSTLDEDNYTICHGTPHSRSPRADISSPKDWPNNAGNKAPPLLSPHQQQAVADHRNRLHSLGHSDSVPVNPSPPAEGVFSPPPQGNSPGVVMRGSPLDHPRPGSGGHMQQESGGSGGHTPTNVHPGSHHFPADYYHKDWSATGLAQYAGMTGGYPGMYNHAIPGLPYGPHAVQQIPGSNYAYPMPYSWTHHPSQLGSHGDHMIQQQRQSAGQQARAGEVAHHQSRQGIPGGGAESPGYPPAQLRQQMQSSTWFKEQGYPDSSPVTSPPPPATMEKLPHTSNSSGQIPAPILHQLGTSVSSQHGLTPHHQLTHPFSRSSSHSIAHEHMPHPHFPYSFDASSPASLHMWQQSQMQSQQIRQMHHHPPHLAPPPGLWYAPTAPHLPSHLIPQGGKKSSGGKMKTNGGEPPHAKISANRNTNNNNCSLVEDKLYVAKYKSRAFRDQHEGSAAESGLLVSNLATSQHKQAPPSGLWGEGGRGGGGAGDTSGYLHGIVNFPPPQDNVSASKESIGQHSSPPVDNYL